MIHVFGDSWAEGYGLTKTERNFSDFLGEHYQVPVANHGLAASSMGHVTLTVAKQQESFSPGDTVICILPPDTRWYNVTSDTTAHSLFNGMPEYEEFLKIFNSEAWFVYHHSLFIYTIQNIARDKGVNLLLAHNYGYLSLSPLFRLQDTFLNKEKSLVHYLLGKEGWENNLEPVHTNAMGQTHIVGDYFIPNDNHPNEAGHRYIADLFIKRLDSISYK